MGANRVHLLGDLTSRASARERPPGVRRWRGCGLIKRDANYAPTSDGRAKAPRRDLSAPASQVDPDGRLGFPGEYLGDTHVPLTTKVRYAYGPPASGNHFAVENRGPLPARVYPANQEPGCT